MNRLIVLLLIAITMNSCMVNYHMVGEGAPKDKSGATKYTTTTQFYLFYGLIRINRADIEAPKDKPYLIRTSYNFWDSLLTAVTVGIVSARHEVIYVN